MGWKHEVNRCKDAEAVENAYDSMNREILSPWETAKKQRPERFKPLWNWRTKMLARQQTWLYRAIKTLGKHTDLEKYTPVENEMKRQAKVKQKTKQRLMKELCKASREDLGKLANKLIRKIKKRSEEKVDHLKPR